MTQPTNHRLLTESRIGAANGIASLDSLGRIPSAQLPDQLDIYVGTTTAEHHAPALGLFFAEAEGAIGDGLTTNQDVPINAAIAAAVANGGGTVFLRAGTYLINAPIIQPSSIPLVGVDSGLTVLKLANGANCDIVQSQNCVSLSGSNKWLVSDGVPFGMGVLRLRIDGNKANNTSGNRIRYYAKRYRLDDVIVHDCAGHGLYSEGANAGGQTQTDDMPETEVGTFWSRNNNGDGVFFRGPHDAHFGIVYTVLNGGDGFYCESVAGSYGGLVDIGFLHSYGNTGNGLVLNAPVDITHCISESNGQRGIYSAASFPNSRIGVAFVFNNQTSAAGLQTAPSVEIASSGMTIGALSLRLDNGGTGLLASGALTNSLYLTVGEIAVDGKSTNAIGVDIASNNVTIGKGMVHDASAAGGVGVQIEAGVSQVDVDVVSQNNETQIKYLGGVTRCKFNVRGFINTGQTGWSGTYPDLTLGNVVKHQFGGTGSGIDYDSGIGGSSWNGGHIKVGTFHVWIDSTGALRMKNGAPTSDTDGSPVGNSTTGARSQLTGPTSTLAVTYLRDGTVTATAAPLPASGTVQVALLPVEKTVTASKINLKIGTTAGAGTTGNVHQWAALTNGSGTVLAVTTDQLATALTGTLAWSLTAPITLSPGTYYVHLCIVMDTTMPTIYGRTGLDGSASIPPILAGTGSTGQTVPPAVGGTLALPSAAASPLPYVWLT